MWWRYNPDEEIRELERLAQSGDVEAGAHYVRKQARIGRVPPNLLTLLDYIEPRYHLAYYGLIRFLTDAGIPFEFRPSNHCNCENTACEDTKDHVKLADHCENYDCYSATMEEIPHYPSGELVDPENDGLLKGGICLQPDCPYEGKPQWTLAGCNRVAWRAYEDTIGAMCDICAERMPLSYHSGLCNCPQCGTGIGPLIIVRTQIVEPIRLEILHDQYLEVFHDDRTVTQPFIERLNISPEEDARRAADATRHDYEYELVEDAYEQPRATPGLNSFESCLVEVLPDGTYRLRMFQHLRPQDIVIRNFATDIKYCQRLLSSEGFRSKQFVTLKQVEDACDLVKYHYLGRDFSLGSLIDHLTNYRPPDLREIAEEMSVVMDPLYFDSQEIQQLDPNALRATLVGLYTVFNTPIRAEIIRTSMFDEINFYTPHKDMSVFHTLILHTSYNHPRAATPERIIEAIHREIAEGT